VSVWHRSSEVRPGDLALVVVLAGVVVLCIVLILSDLGII
jgi:hypothetical protein